LTFIKIIFFLIEAYVFTLLLMFLLVFVLLLFVVNERKT